MKRWIKIFVLEFTDEKITLFNKKRKKIIEEEIPNNLIVKNKIYDFVKLEDTIYKIINKNNIIKNFFKTEIKILVYEKITPAEEYLYKKLFDSISNVNVKLVFVNNLLDGDNHIFVCGKEIYYQQNILKELVNRDNEYILVGNSDKLELIKDKLIKRFKINILLYENSNTILFEKA